MIEHKKIAFFSIKINAKIRTGTTPDLINFDKTNA
jgi:hypothetical protein